MGTKNNPGQFDCYHNAEPDEPMFILLARDPLAPALTELWAKLRFEMLGPTDDPTHCRQAEEVAAEMRKWIATNRPGKRMAIVRQ